MKTIEISTGSIKIYETVIEEEDYASSELIQERLDTCYSCEFNVNQESCSKCSCLLAHRTKYKDLFCPEGKW